MLFYKKKQRIRSLLDDGEEECMKAMGMSRGGSSSHAVAGMRVAGVFMLAFAFVYVVFSVGGHGRCFGYLCRERSSQDMAAEMDREIERRDNEERESIRYLDYEDVVPPEPESHRSSLRHRRSDDNGGSGDRTGLGNIVFGVAASSRLWEKRKEYVKVWWRPGEMRGFVWLDRYVGNWSTSLPPEKVSEETSRFNYTNRRGSRSAIRISRIVSETVRLGLPDVHWIVMGDDDTVFVPENLVKVLSKYDHNKYFYIGSHSESHTQNVRFSYNMAYGGGGFAISYSLAKALEKIHDKCIQRYPYLYGSDDRIQACLAELGVPLTKEPGFHQFDVYGDVFGLLAAHPVTPLVSIHHLDLIDPVFPNKTQIEALKLLKKSMRADPSGVLQQSICYDKWRKWSVSISWGYAVQVYRGLIEPRILELPMRTFHSWYRKQDGEAFPFSTRPALQNPCEQPAVFYLKDVGYGDEAGQTLSNYLKDPRQKAECKSPKPMQHHSPMSLEQIRVIKDQADDNWHLAPRRQCCRVLQTNKKVLELSVGDCESDETIF